MNDSSHQCHKDGCDSAARYGVRFHLNCCAPGVVQPVHMNCSIEVCERHKDELDVRRYLLNDHNKEAIATTLMEQGGHPEPDWLSARVEFTPLEPTVIHAPGLVPVACDRANCAQPATFQVLLRFRMKFQKGKGDYMVDSLTNLVVCDMHKAMTTPASFADRGTRELNRQILAGRGITDPDLRTMAVDFVPLPTGARLDPKEWVGDGVAISGMTGDGFK